MRMHYTRPLILLAVLSNFLACNSTEKAKSHAENNDTTISSQSLNINSNDSAVLFRSIKDVVDYDKAGVWANISENNKISCELFFKYSGEDTLSVEYSPECWVYFPFIYDAEKITVYWEYYLDTKYEFDIVKTIKKIDKKYKGKPFMTLRLINDTTLQATYNTPEIRNKLNSADTSKLMFADQYTFKKSLR